MEKDYAKLRREIAGYKCMILHLLQKIETDDLTDLELELAGQLFRSSDVKALLEECKTKDCEIIA